jgi:hexosaminidase
MKISSKSLLFMLFCLLVAGVSHAHTMDSGKYNIIPYPANLEPGQGSFTVNKQTALVIKPGAAVFANEQLFLKRMIGSYLGERALIVNKSAQSNAIVLKYDPSITVPEAYKITVTPAAVTLSAKEPAGMFYAMETLRQLLPADLEVGKGKTLTIPAVSISDKPAFAWRGMMLDVSRHFFSIHYLEKYVDLMALYKLNKLHLHLTDDQGWRIEIKKYPRLTSEGAWRTYDRNDSACMKKVAETGNTDFNLDQEHIIQRDGKTLYGGFYTQEEMKGFIQYAMKRHVEIIPEIDMPGHMMAAIKIYPTGFRNLFVRVRKMCSNLQKMCTQSWLLFSLQNIYTLAATR